MDTFSKRLKEALYRSRLNQLDIAKAMCVSRSSVNRWFNDAGTPQPKMLKDIALTLGVNEAWLRSGDGEMLDGLGIKVGESEPVSHEEKCGQAVLLRYLHHATQADLNATAQKCIADGDWVSLQLAQVIIEELLCRCPRNPKA